MCRLLIIIHLSCSMFINLCTVHIHMHIHNIPYTLLIKHTSPTISYHQNHYFSINISILHLYSHVENYSHIVYIYIYIDNPRYIQISISSYISSFYHTLSCHHILSYHHTLSYFIYHCSHALYCPHTYIRIHITYPTDIIYSCISFLHMY